MFESQLLIVSCFNQEPEKHIIVTMNDLSAAFLSRNRNYNPTGSHSKQQKSTTLIYYLRIKTWIWWNEISISTIFTSPSKPGSSTELLTRKKAQKWVYIDIHCGTCRCSLYSRSSQLVMLSWEPNCKSCITRIINKLLVVTYI